MGTSVTYVAGTYSGLVLLAAPILRTCPTEARHYLVPLSFTERFRWDGNANEIFHTLFRAVVLVFQREGTCMAKV